MAELDQITKQVLAQIDGAGFQQKGAFNLRHNGIALCHGDSEHIKIKKKMEKAASELNFEAAAEYRDKLIELKNKLRDL